MVFWLFLAVFSLDTILNQPELAAAHYGIYIVRLDNDSIIYSYNNMKCLIPASNMKIITTAAALTFLGSEFRFKTRLGLRGQLKDNKFIGDIVIIGGGDPGFSLEDLGQFIATIKRLNIEKITGNIIVVDDYFTDERLPIGWSWHYLDARYGAEISALSFNKNCVNVKLEATIPGELANVTIEPLTDYVKLVNTMKTRNGKDSIIIYRRPEANIIYVAGGLGKGHKRAIMVAIKNPALFTGEYFKERLTKENIKFTGQVFQGNHILSYKDISKITVIDSIFSQLLVDIIKETNTESENLYAEILLKTLGVEKYGEGSFANGLSVLKNFLRLCLADTTNISFADGSGLSKHNLVSPYNLVMVLRYMYYHPLFKSFYESLPRPGIGTLEYRFNGFPDSLHAKTGAVHAVSCLSGYLNVNGIDYCFSLMFNNYTCPLKKITDIQEQVIKALVEYLKEK